MGRGYPDLIVADLANVMRKQDPVSFYAHEATHFYYARLALARRTAQAESPRSHTQEALVTLITKLHEESLGDQHDKVPLLALDSVQPARLEVDSAWLAYIGEYATEYSRAQTSMRDFLAAPDQAIADTSAGKLRIESLSRALPLEGRPLGAWITTAIRRTQGDAQIANAAGDPVAWALAYQA